MFDKDRFIQDCIDARNDGQRGIRELLCAAVEPRNGIIAALGEAQHAGAVTAAPKPAGYRQESRLEWARPPQSPHRSPFNGPIQWK